MSYPGSPPGDPTNPWPVPGTPPQDGPPAAATPPSYGGAPAYAPPAYPPPAYAPTQPAYGAGPVYPPTPYGSMPTQPPAPKRSYAVIIVAVVAAVVLIGGGVGAVLILRNNSKPSANGTPSASASVSPTAATTTPAGSGTVTLAAPATIGSLTKSPDQSVAESLLTTLSSSGMEQPFAVAYRDAQRSTRTVVIWGGTGALFQSSLSSAELKGFFQSGNAQFPGQKIDGLVDVPAGSTGGTAQCETIHGGVAITLCAWIGDGALLGFVFGGYPRADADTLLPEVLSAIVQKP